MVWILDKRIMVPESEYAHLLFCLPPGNLFHQHSDPTYCDTAPLQCVNHICSFAKDNTNTMYCAHLLEMHQTSFFHSEKELHCPLDKAWLYCK